MQKSLIAIFISFLIFCSCDYKKFADGVQQDTRRSILSHKFFFKNLKLKGKIKQKIYCHSCLDNKYQLVINIISKSPENINIGDVSYEPYYHFINANNQLVISVNKVIYASASENESIEKGSDSYLIVINNNKYQLISDEANKWLYL